MQLYQAKSKSEAKTIIFIMIPLFIINFIALYFALYSLDYITIIWCSVASIVTATLIYQLKTQLSTDNFNKHNWQ